TAFTRHDAIAAIDVASEGPSKMPHPCAHAYSAPDRFTPSSRTGVPFWSTRWLPLTCTARVAACAGRGDDAAPTPRAAACPRTMTRATRLPIRPFPRGSGRGTVRRAPTGPPGSRWHDGVVPEAKAVA